MVVQPSPGASAIPLSIEPVIGWRLWCIDSDDDGRLVLTSPMQDHTWIPREASQAKCQRHRGRGIPNPTCGCGFYAVLRLDRLPRAFGITSHQAVGVVGSVAMWGRVIEHAAGYRSQKAYPDRIRLVCRACFLTGRDGVPTRIERDVIERLVPVCETHATPDANEGPLSPDEVQHMLMSAYAVDPLPLETLNEAGYLGGHPSPSRLLPAAKAELRELARTRLGIVTIALVVAAIVALRALGLFETPGAREIASSPRPSPVEVEAPSADDLDAGPPADLVHPSPDPGGHRAFTFGVVCGHRIGIAVQIMRCGRARAELFGVYESPPDRRSTCYMADAYTRKQNLSVCWLDFTDDPGPPLDLLRLPGVHLWDLA
jgi:hypothetical protein